ncbi:MULTISPECIES: DMT family transporter [unclassified Shewanella]|uniref:DMT family transporter n=1 Tax=unclassified Shewanella TaxID=196818 RepID=UPI001BBA24FC|nr:MULTISPECIES: DMT family transporter [unclassified Shewanella]GIU08159.1 multidrug DMT transporter [Shewanella sp. MBTL60-112-B1]GIU40639.1 multidrug DMT transporter [Shewanella sp. MBTL60-112-B2]
MFKSALPHIQMLIFTFVIAMTFPIGKQLMLEVPPMIATWLRYVIAAILFTLLLALTRQLQLPSRKSLLRYTLVCLPSLFYFTAMFSALTQTTAFATSALYTCVPLITAILVVLVNRHIGKLTNWAALGLGFAGALALVMQQAGSSSVDINWNSGYSLFMLGCVAMAANPLVIKACYRQENFMVFTGWSLIAASFILSLALLPEITAYDWGRVSQNAWLSTLYLAIFATAISFFLFQKASIRLAPEQVSAYIFLIPVFVLLTADSIEISWGYAIPALLAVTFAMALLMRKR